MLRLMQEMDMDLGVGEMPQGLPLRGMRNDTTPNGGYVTTYGLDPEGREVDRHNFGRRDVD